MKNCQNQPPKNLLKNGTPESGEKGLKMEKLEAEIDYLLYRLQALGEEPDRIRSYKERIDQHIIDLSTD